LNDKLRAAIEKFIDTIEATGGVFKDRKGYHIPIGDQEWLDLGEAYVAACEAIGREPKIVEDPNDS
jgi:hypothetical protein